MCTSPILIRNRKYRSLDVKIPNSFINVPCGRCDECLRKRAKDLYVRARYQAEEYFLNGGCGFMTTLTYGTTLAPTIEHLGKKHYCFNKKHVIDFIKRLRTNLDRFYKKHYGLSAPDFKYLITSEYGSDPTRSQLPHYHGLFLFPVQVSLFAFRRAFVLSLSNRKEKKQIFGKIYQCDPLDLKRGGVKYVCKYILKDFTFNSIDSTIRDKINFYTHYVNSFHGINEFPETSDELFRNKCIRSTKAYKVDVNAYIKPLRHCLQFYMCSNDFGCSAICSRFGQNLYTLGLLTIDGLPYSIPKQVLQRLERTEGTDKRDMLSKSVFLSQFKKCVIDCHNRGLISNNEALMLPEFVEKFIQPRFGSLYFVHPSAVSYWNSISSSPVLDFQTIYDELCFYDDNNFFEYREKVINVINLSNSKTLLDFRRSLAFSRTTKEREDYERKKRNKPSNY